METERIILKAIESGSRLHIIYEGANGISERFIKPVKLSDGELSAYCYMKHGMRKFKLEGILGASVISGRDDHEQHQRR